MPRTLVTLLLGILLPLLGGGGVLFAQERPQSTAPAPSPERQAEIRDSIRQRARVKFREREEAEREGGIRYEADRALLMPAMERSSMFRLGVPGWLIRLGVGLGRDEFDSDEEYRATRELLRGIRGIRIAAFAPNPAYDPGKLRRQYARYVKRRRAEPVMFVRAREGGVSIDVKVRRGKVKLVTLMAYGEEGAAVIRLKSRLKEKHLKGLIAYMTEEADEELGVEVDVAP